MFHYEFEFIHPFVDGNGRTGRLWQSLILGKLHPLFEHLPVENMLYANQQAYYDAITASTNPSLSASEIADRIGISKRGVEKQLKKFKDAGILTRKGNNRTGSWIINKRN